MNMQENCIKTRRGVERMYSPCNPLTAMSNSGVEHVNHSVFRKDISPFVLWFLWLIALTLTIDYLLHYTQALWIERYLGIFGTLLIILSFVYSLRKKKIITFGKPKTFLRIHEYLAWTGSLMVLVHGGIHFNAVLAWLADLIPGRVRGRYFARRLQIGQFVGLLATLIIGYALDLYAMNTVFIVLGIFVAVFSVPLLINRYGFSLSNTDKE